MRSKQKLILLTTNFPYEKGEEFLEAEVTILSKNFSVSIVPLYIKGGKRSISGAVHIDNSLANFLSKHSLRKIFPLVLSGNFFVKYFRLKHIFMLKKFTWTIHNTLLIKKWAESNSFKFDSQTIIYSYWYDIATNGVALSNAKYKKLITRVHGYDLYEERHSPPIILLRKHTINKVDKIYCISTDGKNYIKRKYAKKNIEVSRLGTRNPFVCNLFSRDKKIRVVSCSYIMPVKRLDRILKALIRMSNMASNNIEWVHIGGGNNKLKAKILEAVNKSKPKNLNINFIGHLDNKNVFDYYKNAEVDVFINMSESEGIPVSIMEAISFGIPVIAPDVGGIREIVTNKSGILLSANPSTLSIVEALLTIIKEPETQKGIRREEVRKFWEKNYSAKINYELFVRNLKKAESCKKGRNIE